MTSTISLQGLAQSPAAGLKWEPFLPLGWGSFAPGPTPDRPLPRDAVCSSWPAGGVPVQGVAGLDHGPSSSDVQVRQGGAPFGFSGPERWPLHTEECRSAEAAPPLAEREGTSNTPCLPAPGIRKHQITGPPLPNPSLAPPRRPGKLGAVAPPPLLSHFLYYQQSV